MFSIPIICRFIVTVIMRGALTIEATPVDQLAVTIITIEEQLRAWYTQVRRARDAERLARAYQGLFEVAETAKFIRVLPFTSHAVARYLDLRNQLPRLGNQWC